MYKRFQYSDSGGREKLTEAFKLLRKEGLIAKQNFSCCGSCGTYEIGEQAKIKAKKVGKFPKGYVMYNRQSTEGIETFGSVNLSYGAFYSRNDIRRKECFTDLEIGRLIEAKMKEVGLKTEWNGDVHKCVSVDVEGVGFNYDPYKHI